ncbi:hypothetical protein GJV44_p00028 (plasmid) [Candidatus Vallotia cooleyia]|nr:hypothetical protein GJV44_p00028 [Candidatus Vallotia cooleyia]
MLVLKPTKLELILILHSNFYRPASDVICNIARVIAITENIRVIALKILIIKYMSCRLALRR